MAVQIYGNGDNTTQGAQINKIFYDKLGIKNANVKNIYHQFCAVDKMIPQNRGNGYAVSRFLHMYDRPLNDPEFSSKGFLTSRDISSVNNEITNNVALAEGALAGNRVNLKKVTVTGTTHLYGQMLEYTLDNLLFSEDPNMKGRYYEEIGALANVRHEDLIQRDMLATSTVMYGGAATSISQCDQDSKVTLDLIRKAEKLLFRNRAMKTKSIIVGSEKVGTKPVPAAYTAIIGPEVKFDLEDVTKKLGANEKEQWIPVHKYSNTKDIVEGERGILSDTRFVESELALVYKGQGAVPPKDYNGTLSYSGHTDITSTTESERGNFDVFPILYPTPDSFACVGLKGKGKIEFNEAKNQDIDLNNMYGQRGAVSYNFRYGSVILQEEKLLKILVTASQ